MNNYAELCANPIEAQRLRKKIESISFCIVFSLLFVPVSEFISKIDGCELFLPLLARMGAESGHG